MLRRRRIMLLAVLLGSLGSLGATLAWGMYLRSGEYRRRLAATVSARVGLAVEIGRVQALHPTARTVHGVVVPVPEQREPLFHCRRATWRGPRRGAAREARLELQGAALNIHDPAALRALQATLGHDLGAADGLRHVLLDGAELDCALGPWTARLGALAGGLTFEPGRKRAAFSASQLNGHALEEPLRIEAVLDDDTPAALDAATVTIPALPLAWLMPASATWPPVRDGRLAGRLRREADGWHLDGRLEGSRLPGVETSGAAPAARLPRVDVEAWWGGDGLLRRVLWRGQLLDVGTSELAAMLGVPSPGGCLQLEVRRAEMEGTRLRTLQVRGRWSDIDLGRWSLALGAGVVEGSLDVVLDDLHIVDGSIVRGDLTVVATPPADRLATIERRLIDSVVAAAGLTPPPLPDEELEYAGLAFRVRIDGPAARLHGVEGPVVLAVRLLGRDVPVITAPPGGVVLDHCRTATSGEIEPAWWSTLARVLGQGPPAAVAHPDPSGP